MSVNSSSSNDLLSVTSSDLSCLIFVPPASFIFLTYNITNILLLLPLCIFILHHGLQQWRQKRSTSSAVTVSHSDVFTYHMVVMELLCVFGCVLCCGAYMKNATLLTIGNSFFFIAWFGETFFHNLTCVERYLAVVHPITYRNLKTERGIRIRNISIACVWLLSFAWVCVDKLASNGIIIDAFCISLMVFSLIVVSFCSLSVLCVLIRPGPGERGGDRQRVDQSKLRAFYTITAILGVLLLRCACGLIWLLLLYFSREIDQCMLVAFEFWVYLPGTVVLPLLFLKRAGKCCNKKSKQ